MQNIAIFISNARIHTTDTLKQLSEKRTLKSLVKYQVQSMLALFPSQTELLDQHTNDRLVSVISDCFQ